MNFLYISVLASQIALSKAQRSDPSFSSFAVQKFNRLIVDGLARNGHSVRSLSSFYQPNVGIGYSRKSEKENEVTYTYIPTLNFRPIRMVWVSIYCFFYVLVWGLRNRKEKAVICDVLNVSACLGALAAASMLGLRCVGVMTDMLGIGVSNNRMPNGCEKVSFAMRINRLYLSHFTHYVFLTEQMNKEVNINRCPYIVMEGLVDADVVPPKIIEKEFPRVVLYAGGLYERYGLKTLTDAFMSADLEDTELWLYGSGSFVDELSSYQLKDSRIKYKGIRPNDEVFRAEQRAVLLVNPRPTSEEYAKYSFPSKNMEYMVSSTPVLTTKLPGMPVEYYPHVYLFDSGENAEGYAKVLRRVLSQPAEELDAKGKEAFEWVLAQKNNITQTARIIELLNN